MSRRGRGSESGEARVLEVLAASTRGPLKPKEIARAASVAASEYKRFKRLLTGLERAGKIYRVKGHRYALSGSLELSPGIVSLTRAGDAFVRPDAGGGDLFVPAAHLATAMDGDHVVTRIEARPRGRSPVARVIKVLDRARATIVGTFHRSPPLHYVVPMDRRPPKALLLLTAAAAQATPGDRLRGLHPAPGGSPMSYPGIVAARRPCSYPAPPPGRQRTEMSSSSGSTRTGRTGSAR